MEKKFQNTVLTVNLPLLQFSVAYIYRGLLKVKLEQKDGACIDFRKAGYLGLKDAYELIKKYCQ